MLQRTKYILLLIHCSLDLSIDLKHQNNSNLNPSLFLCTIFINYVLVSILLSFLLFIKFFGAIIKLSEWIVLCSIYLLVIKEHEWRGALKECEY